MEPDQPSVTLPPGSVIITPTQMYVELQDMGKKLDHLASVIDPTLTTIRDDVKDHEERVRSLERWRWVAFGVATAGAAGTIAQAWQALGN